MMRVPLNVVPLTRAHVTRVDVTRADVTAAVTLLLESNPPDLREDLARQIGAVLCREGFGSIAARAAGQPPHDRIFAVAGVLVDLVWSMEGDAPVPSGPPCTAAPSPLPPRAVQLRLIDAHIARHGCLNRVPPEAFGLDRDAVQALREAGIRVFKLIGGNWLLGGARASRAQLYHAANFRRALRGLPPLRPPNPAPPGALAIATVSTLPADFWGDAKKGIDKQERARGERLATVAEIVDLHRRADRMLVSAQAAMENRR